MFLLDEEGTVPLPAMHIRDLESGDRQERFRHRLMQSDVTVGKVPTSQHWSSRSTTPWWSWTGRRPSWRRSCPTGRSRRAETTRPCESWRVPPA